MVLIPGYLHDLLTLSHKMLKVNTPQVSISKGEESVAKKTLAALHKAKAEADKKKKNKDKDHRSRSRSRSQAKAEDGYQTDASATSTVSKASRASTASTKRRHSSGAGSSAHGKKADVKQTP